MVMKNPFVTNGYAGPEYFCDRVEETQHITEMLTNENNMALISPRRIGKTELIHHCFAQPVIQKDYYTFIIDIYSTNSVSDLVNMFGKAIIDELRPKGRSAWEKFLMALSSLRSEISFDINGAPVWGIGIGNMMNPEITLDEIFTYLNQADKPCLVAIDEFQQITNYAVTGPAGRASGWKNDTRKRHPYDMYDKVEWKEITLTGCDSMDRYYVHIQELYQSLDIIEQLIDNIPEGEYYIKQKPIIKVPEGQWYFSVEGASGEFGVYLDSKGDKSPYRMKMRPMGLSLTGALDPMLRGQKIADLITTGAAIDFVIPDIDR